MHGPDKDLWEQGLLEEWIRLYDSNTTRFVPPSALPLGRKASYFNPQIKKKEREGGHIEYRVRGTYGGNRGDYTGETTADTADMATFKLMMNSIVSTPNAKFMTADIKDFYLGTPLTTKEYMWVQTRFLPPAIIEKYSLRDMIVNDRVLVEISQGIYGLAQAGRLAQQRLFQQLAKHGYQAAPNTPCLFTHATRPIQFILVVDDFGIKYTNTEDADHLIACLRELYTLKVDWTGSKYIGYDIEFTPATALLPRACTIDMLRYIPRALQRFNIHHDQRTDNPAPSHPISYAQANLTPEQDTSPPLGPADVTRVQQIIGVLLYYARAVDMTLFTRVNKVGSLQARPTAAVLAAAEQLLAYAATHPDASITYYDSDMRLIVHSDASYLSESKARSRIGGYYYLGNDEDDTIINGAVTCLSSIIDVVVSSATEAEYGATFSNGKIAEGLRVTLAELGHPQAPTLLICDNQCSTGIANDTVTQRKSKAMDMRFNWIRDRIRQGHFRAEWRQGKYNLADYFTKDHATPHFKVMRPFFVGRSRTRLRLAQLPNPKLRQP
jgi:hypothetical protein